MAEPKTVPTGADVGAFMDAIEHPTRRADCRVLVKMMTEVTGVEPVMWGPSIIGFGTYHSVYASGREGDWPRLGMSPRKASLVAYLTDGFSEWPALLAKLGKHKTGKSCLYLGTLDKIDLEVLRALIAGSWAAVLEKYPLET